MTTLTYSRRPFAPKMTETQARICEEVFSLLSYRENLVGKTKAFIFDFVKAYIRDETVRRLLNTRIKNSSSAWNRAGIFYRREVLVSVTDALCEMYGVSGFGSGERSEQELISQFNETYGARITKLF